ncbi:MAG TPA: formate dehydrogenase accessory protein FdhE [Methylomirabilota bacterium]|nr:formate dehydrogenase accessory protein FdhE [Methylomirabilota bacterium]
MRDSLSIYEGLLEAWVRWPESRLMPLRWSSAECRARWERSQPLIVDAPLEIPLSEIEDQLVSVLELVAGLGEAEAQAVERLALALTTDPVSVSTLLRGLRNPDRGAMPSALPCPTDLLAFVTYGSLRPLLEEYFLEARPHFGSEFWDQGHCPFCGAFPAFIEFGDDGKRRLVCHLCSGVWTLGRLRCPYCDNRDPKSLVRLAAEGGEEGYLIEACDLCKGYLKGVDRRLRWDLGSPIIEDWGSPHLDLIAQRKGYWRATPCLIQLAHVES